MSSQSGNVPGCCLTVSLSGRGFVLGEAADIRGSGPAWRHACDEQLDPHAHGG